VLAGTLRNIDASPKTRLSFVGDFHDFSATSKDGRTSCNTALAKNL